MPLRERRRRPAAHARHADRGGCPKSNRTPPASRPRPQRRCVRCASGCTPRRTSGMAPMSPPACSRPDSSRRGPARPHASPRSRHAPTDRAPPRDGCAPGRSPCLARRAPRHRPARHPASRRALPAQSPRTSPRQVRPCAQFIEIALSKLADTKSEPPFSNTSTFVSASFESAIHEQPPIRHHADAVY